MTINVITAGSTSIHRTTWPSRAVKWVSTYPTYHGSWLRCMPHMQESCGTLSSSSHTLTVTQVTSMRHIFYFRDANLFSTKIFQRHMLCPWNLLCSNSYISDTEIIKAVQKENNSVAVGISVVTVTTQGQSFLKYKRNLLYKYNYTVQWTKHVYYVPSSLYVN